MALAVLALDADKCVVEDAAIEIAVFRLLRIRAEENVLDSETLVKDLLKCIEMILDSLVTYSTDVKDWISSLHLERPFESMDYVDNGDDSKSQPLSAKS